MPRLLSLPIAVAFFLPCTARAQLPDSGRPAESLDSILADSNLVHAGWWPIGTITKNTLYVMFKPQTSEADRLAAVRVVHGVVLHRDSIPLEYLIRVASHPNACGVKQAMDLLHTLPQVAAVILQMIMVWEGMGNLGPVPGATQGSSDPCPKGSELLK